MNEITRIYYYKFERQDKRKAKERIRDMFILGCLTALRYSDYSRLTSQNLINGYIVIRTKKMNVDVKVPAHDYVKEIYAKYGGFIPRGLCIQYVNKYLKVIMKEIGLNDLKSAKRKNRFSKTKLKSQIGKSPKRKRPVSRHTHKNRTAFERLSNGIQTLFFSAKKDSKKHCQFSKNSYLYIVLERVLPLQFFAIS